MSNSNLVLIGTLHDDGYGPVRLEKLLQSLAPQLIALEWHKERDKVFAEYVETQERLKSRLLELLDKKGFNKIQQERFSYIFSQIVRTSGYEGQVAKDYVSKNPEVELEYIDDPIIASQSARMMDGNAFSFWLEIIQNRQNKAKLRKMLNTKGSYADMTDSKEMDQSYLAIRNGLIDPIMVNPKTVLAAQVMVRDPYMEREIRRMYGDGSKKLVSPVGTGHLYGLRKRLSDLDPTVMTLLDADKIAA